MAEKNPTDCVERSPSTPAEQDTQAEQAVLVFLLDEHPDHQLTIPEVSRAMNAGETDFGSEDAIERAIRELVGAGLLHCQHGFVLPTRAVLYVARLWGV
jgi:spore germination protein GerM